jgi:hypothetical protein
VGDIRSKLKPYYSALTTKEKIEDTKGVVRSRKSKKGRQWPKDKRTNNDLHNSTQETKDYAT